MAMHEFERASIAQDGITAHEAANIARVSVASIVRWMGKGIRRGDERIVLPWLKIGGRKKTSRASLDWFFARLSEAPDPNAQTTPTIRSTSARRRESEAAAERLRQMGVKC